MVGGGAGAFIGNVHRMAAAIDGEIELVCGAFSSNSERSRNFGKSLYLPPDRVYESFEEMIGQEKHLPVDKSMDFVSIVTPNNLHFEPAILALEKGFHVMCDKPMTFNLEEALTLQATVKETGLLFGLTHNYTGYPMVKQARHVVQTGQLGNLRKVIIEYSQGWLTMPIEKDGQKQASWRTDPNMAGKSGCMGDIGTHAENLCEYITGQRIIELCADLTTFVKNRQLDDDGNVLIRLENGAKGILHASQICVGRENGLNISLYGDKGGIEWQQENPNILKFRKTGRPLEIYTTGAGNTALCDSALGSTRLPPGHPEGFIEAFANLYRDFGRAIQSRLEGCSAIPSFLDFPSVDDGVRGMKFIDKVVESSRNNSQWVVFD